MRTLKTTTYKLLRRAAGFNSPTNQDIAVSTIAVLP